MIEDKKLERNLIAQVLAQTASAGLVKMCASFLTADDFTNKEDADVWSRMVRLAADGKECGLVNVHATYSNDSQKWDGYKYLATDIEGDILSVAMTIHELAVKRRLTEQVTKTIVGMDSGMLTSSEAAELLAEAVEEATKQSQRKVTKWLQLHNDVIKQLQDQANGIAPMSRDCGFFLLDKEQVIADGSLIIIAGRTSNGKTALALNIAYGLAQRGTPTCIYSLEMTNRQVGYRMASNASDIDSESLKRADLTDKQWDRITATDADLPLYFDDSRNNDRAAIFASIRNLVDTLGIKVVFIDYLQLMKGSGKDRRIDIGEIANDLKVLAVKLGITIVLLSQLAREARGTAPVPRLSELKESGEIENAADAVYLIYRPEQHGVNEFPDLSKEWSQYSVTGNAMLICAKNRLGRCGEQLLGWDGAKQRFFQRSHYDARISTATDYNDINKQHEAPF